jgi:DNA polymerase I-like protein with 3'-5' exonuclease and polymerase domains
LRGQISAREITILESQFDALSQDDAPQISSRPDPAKPSIIRDTSALSELAARVAESEGFVVDLETSDLDHRKGEIVGIGLAVAEATYYVPVSHRFRGSRRLRPGQLPFVEVLPALRLEQRPWIGHNLKFELKWLRHHGNVSCRLSWDTMIAARLLRSDLKADLKTVAMRELDVPDWGMSAAEMRDIQFMPIETVAGYCAKDCWYTLLLCRRQKVCLV